jgi:ubiquinone biosynthesis monooxygenase Coq6
LIEAGDLFSTINTNDYTNRVSSLTPSSVSYLKELGAWDYIPLDRKKEYQHMQVWDACSQGKIEFNGNPVATIVENRFVQQSLVKTLDGLDSITVFNKERVKSITTQEERPMLSLESGKMISCDLLVMACLIRLGQMGQCLKFVNLEKLVPPEWITISMDLLQLLK